MDVHWPLGLMTTAHEVAHLLRPNQSPANAVPERDRAATANRRRTCCSWGKIICSPENLAHRLSNVQSCAGLNYHRSPVDDRNSNTIHTAAHKYRQAAGYHT